jgi:purine nucleosidase
MVWMGGAVDVPGNVTADAEFNAYVDPEAAGEVFEAGLRVDLVPLDATRQTRIDGGQLHAALARRPGPVAARIAAFTEQTFRTWGYMNLHDPLVERFVALFFDRLCPASS